MSTEQKRAVFLQRDLTSQSAGQSARPASAGAFNDQSATRDSGSDLHSADEWVLPVTQIVFVILLSVQY